jgi:ferredoxin
MRHDSVIDTLVLIDETDCMSTMYCQLAVPSTTIVVDDGDARGARVDLRP